MGTRSGSLKVGAIASQIRNLVDGATRVYTVPCLIATLSLTAACTPRPERVVLVTIDTLRADHVGSYGAESARTPTLDGIAAEGVRFETAISPAPLTLPSHSSLMTGLDPPRHGVRNNTTFRLPEDVATLAEHMRAGGFATAAFIAAVVLDRQYGLARGFDHYDDQMSLRVAAGKNSFPERTADRVVDAVLEWLETAPDRFFLWVHLYDPHADYAPPPGFLAAFLSNPYAGEIAFADFQLGSLLKAIRARWTDGRTLIVVTSDHGDSRGEHGELTHSLTIYDATQRVPLVMSGPGLPRGHVVASPVRLIDVAPTILALSDVDPLPDVDGLDLLRVLHTQEPQGRMAYLETLSPQLDFGWSPLLGARSSRFKYIRAPRRELYDLLEDPGETRNLAAERQDLVAKLDAELERRLARSRPTSPTLEPDSEMRARLEELGYVVATSRRSEAELGRVGGIDPKDAMPMVHALFHAMRLLEQGQARAAFERLTRLDGGGWLVDFYRSESARDSGDPIAAEAFARSAIAQAPGNAEPYVSLGRDLAAQQRLDEAWQAFAQANEVDAAASEGLVGMGRVAEARGERARAAELYSQAAERRGVKAEAIWRLAALRIEDGRVEDQALARVSPEALARPDAALRLARAEVRAGLEARARRRLEQALEKSPDSAELRTALDAIGSVR